MVAVSMISLLAGAIAGHRFNVFALVPTTAIALVLTFGIGVAQGDTAWSIVLMATAAAVSVQVGYLVGMCISSVLPTALAGRSPINSRTGQTSARHSAR
jgi:hypothetical protein